MVLRVEEKWKIEAALLLSTTDEAPFAFAGIWDEWRKDGICIASCSIITTTPNELLATIHDRMPVILTAEAQDEWLRGGKPRTIAFWDQKLTRLLEFAPLASSPLDKINKALISSYIQSRHGDVAVATINRELATLRRILYLAHEWN